MLYALAISVKEEHLSHSFCDLGRLQKRLLSVLQDRYELLQRGLSILIVECLGIRRHHAYLHL